MTIPLTTGIDYFESIYAAAKGDALRIPWAHTGPTPALVNWLNVVAPSVVRCGARVAVVGCGLGENAREVRRRGYEVTGFDCSRTAITWAQSLDPECVDGYIQADLFNPPARWTRRFDLVVEVDNIESLSPDRHKAAVKALADLMTPRGLLLVIGRARDAAVRAADDRATGAAPGAWPITEASLLELAGRAGLAPREPIALFVDDDEQPPVARIRGVFGRK